MATKKKSTTPKNRNRRTFIKGAAVAAGVGGLALTGAACEPGSPESARHPLLTDRLDMLTTDAKVRDFWLSCVRDLSNQLVTDADMRERFLSGTNGVQLVKLYNEHADILEPVTGKYDGRTLQGRMAKMLVAAELFMGVSGFDFSDAGDEYQDQLKLNRCNTFMNGCCTLHVWDNDYYARNVST